MGVTRCGGIINRPMRGDECVGVGWCGGVWGWGVCKVRREAEVKYDSIIMVCSVAYLTLFSFKVRCLYGLALSKYIIASKIKCSCIIGFI